MIIGKFLEWVKEIMITWKSPDTFISSWRKEHFGNLLKSCTQIYQWTKEKWNFGRTYLS